MGILKEFGRIFSLFLILDFLFVLNKLLETLLNSMLMAIMCHARIY